MSALTSVLSDRGIAVATASTVDQLVDRIRTFGATFVITDLLMGPLDCMSLKRLLERLSSCRMLIETIPATEPALQETADLIASAFTCRGVESPRLGVAS